MREEIGLLCNGVSGDLELEKATARMLQKEFEHWKKQRLLDGSRMAVYTLPSYPPANRTSTPDPWPTHEGNPKSSCSL